MATAMAQSTPEPYFTVTQLLDAAVYLPAPPDTTSMEFALDMHRYYTAKALRDTERGAQALDDAHGVYTVMCNRFSSAFGINITPEHTPAIYRLLANSLKTTSNACSRCKTHYRRERPFQRFNESSVITGETLSATSFPSTHAAKGWMLALLLAEVNPRAQEALLKRGYEYGQSRVIVGAHWQSDVDAGRMVGSVTYSFMHTSERFLQELAEAQAEFERLQKRYDSRIEIIDAEKVSSVNTERNAAERWYTIYGTLADESTRGIVVKNGKKVLRTNN